MRVYIDEEKVRALAPRITLPELAAAVGISYNTLKGIFYHRTNATLKNAYMFADFLGVTIDDIITIEEED